MGRLTPWHFGTLTTPTAVCANIVITCRVYWTRPSLNWNQGNNNKGDCHETNCSRICHRHRCRHGQYFFLAEPDGFLCRHRKLHQHLPSYPGTASGTAADQPKPEQRLTAEQQALLDNPQTLELANRLDFEEELHTFFANAKSLSSEERAAEAAILEQRLAEYERLGQVSAAESLMVRIAMTKLTIEDEAAQKRALQGLIDRQNAAAQARKEEWLAKPRPEFEAISSRRNKSCKR